MVKSPKHWVRLEKILDLRQNGRRMLVSLGLMSSGNQVLIGVSLYCIHRGKERSGTLRKIQRDDIFLPLDVE